MNSPVVLFRATGGATGCAGLSYFNGGVLGYLGIPWCLSASEKVQFRLARARFATQAPLNPNVFDFRAGKVR